MESSLWVQSIWLGYLSIMSLVRPAQVTCKTKRIHYWCTVEPGNPYPWVHRSSGKLGKASFRTGTVDPRVGISLSPLNTNDGFFFKPTI